jgi:hypothetical protein
MRCLKLYENIVIGNYLFDLGVRMAKLRPNLPLISVNLLQQTPADRLLGDVLLANAGTCRLIEFKRAGKLTRKEMRKLAVLRDGLEKSGSREEAEELSRQIHWYVEIREPRVIGQAVVTRACPYLDFSDDPSFIGLNEFAFVAAEEACDEEPDLAMRENCNRYVKWVCHRFAEIEAEDRAAKGATGKRSSSSTAFIVALNEKREVYWLAVPSIEYAFMNKYELSEALGLEINPDTPRHEQKVEHGYGHGISM